MPTLDEAVGVLIDAKVKPIKDVQDAEKTRLDAARADIDRLKAATPAPGPVPSPPTAPPGGPAPVPGSAPVPAGTVYPSVTAPMKQLGSYMTRVAGAVPGHTGYKGEWRDSVTNVVVGGGISQQIVGKAGDSIIFREWFSKNGGVAGTGDVILDAPPFGPFFAAPVIATPATGLWTDAELERALRCSLGLNESRIQGLNPPAGDTSWQSGGAMTQGSVWNGENKSWNWPIGNAPASYLWPNFDHWGVLFTADGNATDELWIDVKDFDTQFLWQGEAAWRRIKAVQQEVTWANNFAPDMTTSLGTKPRERAGLDGGTSLNLPRQGNVHFGCGTITNVPNLDKLEGVMVSMTYRLDPRSSGQMKGVAQVGGDPKHQMGGMQWWPGFGVSASMDAASDWRKVYFVNVAPSRNGSIPRRLITQERLRAVRPLR